MAVLTALVVCQWLHFGSAMLLFGGSGMREILRGDGYGWNAALDARLYRLLLPAALVALLTAVVWLLLEAASMGGGWGLTIDLGTVRTVLTDTAFGHLWLGRLPLALLLCLVAWLWKRSSFALVLLSAALLASLALTGHAAMDTAWLSLVHPLNQALHMLAAGFWLGGLVPLGLLLHQFAQGPTHCRHPRESGGPRGRWIPAFAGMTTVSQRFREPESAAAAPGHTDQSATARALRRFSDLATIAVLLVLGSGLFNAWMLVGSFSALISTGYGNALLVKLVLVSAMVTLALFNRFSLLPALALRRDAALPRLERNIVIEIVLGAIVLAAASVLGNLPPAQM